LAKQLFRLSRYAQSGSSQQFEPQLQPQSNTIETASLKLFALCEPFSKMKSSKSRLAVGGENPSIMEEKEKERAETH